MTAVRTPLRSAPRRTAVAPGGVRRTRDAQQLRAVPQVAPSAAGERRLGPVWIAVIAAVLMAVLVVTASQALLVQGQDRLDELQRSIADQEQLAERQQLQLAELQAPERIVAAATDRLGMVAPGDVVHLRSDLNDDAAIAVAPMAPGVDGDAPAAAATPAKSSVATATEVGGGPAGAGG